MHFERLVRIDLIQHPQTVRHELEVVRLPAPGNLVELLDPLRDDRDFRGQPPPYLGRNLLSISRPADTP